MSTTRPPPSDFEKLRAMSKMQLAHLGCQLWDGSGLMLFPAEWYEHIPAGFEIVTIFGEKRPFRRSTSDRDRRWGALAFGIIPSH